MSDSRWTRIERLFHGALEQSPDHRDAWLQSKCRDEAELLREVRSLLAANATAEDTPGRVISASARSMGRERELASDQRIGPWRILREIGSGGMGSVYLAERADQAYEQKVAVKIIRGFPEIQALERLRQERQILASLNHGNIAALIDGGTTDEGQPYLVMEYIDGMPVDVWCREQKLNRTWRLRLFREICEAVHYAHRHLIIHRDLKPANILITPDGRPKLLDFGIAKLAHAREDMDGVASTRSLAYATPEYASPEQLAGQPVSTASDIYALGMVLLAMNGHPPGGGKRGERSYSGQRADLRRSLPKDLVAIVEQATREDPSDRYTSVAAMSADIGRFLDNRPVEAVADRLGYRLRRFVSRHRAGSIAGIAGMLTGVALLVGLVTGYERARQAEHRAILEAESANRVADFMVSLFRAADPRVARGETVPVDSVLEQGRRELESEADLDPLLQARLMLALGEVHRHLQNFGEAESLLTGALDRYALKPGQYADQRLHALTELGMVHILAGDPEAARMPLSIAMQMMRDGLLDRPLQIADAHHHWGLVQKDLGHYEQALEHMHKALDLRREHAGDDVVASTLHNIALAEYDQGRMEAAFATLNEALELKRGVMDSSHPSYVTSLSLLSMIHRNLGNFKAARARVEEVLRAHRKLYGNENPALEHSYNELAIAHHDLGEYEQAIANYRRSLELSQGEGDEPKLGEASTLNNLALAHADRGDPATAEPLLRRSLAMRQALFEAHHPRIDHARYNLARLLLDTGRDSEAGELLAKVLAHRMEHRGPDHPRTLQARLLQAELDFRNGRETALGDMAAAVDGLRASLPVGNLKRQAMLRRYGRNLAAAGRLEAARAAINEALGELTDAFGDDHPLAAEARVELAHIERLAGEDPLAEDHLRAAKAVLARSHVPQSRILRKLACLDRGETNPGCWRNAPEIAGKSARARPSPG